MLFCQGLSLNLRQVITAAAIELKSSGSISPRLDVEVIMMYVCKMDHTQLFIHMDDPLPETECSQFYQLIERRKCREPVAYIVGEKEFWSRPFSVNPDVLIPRPETEHLIESVLAQFPDRYGAYKFCDIGTGSGCIAVTLACEYPNASVIATDTSAKAIEAAGKNAKRHGVKDRIPFRVGDMFMALKEEDRGLDLIISNPPYVSSDEYQKLDAGLRFEPRFSLTDEADGLKYPGMLLNQMPGWLKSGGVLIMECGLSGLPRPGPEWSGYREIMDLGGRLRGGLFQLNASFLNVPGSEPRQQ